MRPEAKELAECRASREKGWPKTDMTRGLKTKLEKQQYFLGADGIKEQSEELEQSIIRSDQEYRRAGSNLLISTRQRPPGSSVAKQSQV